MPTADRVLKEKLKALDEVGREQLLKEKRLEKRLAYWRHIILKDYREQKAPV